MPASGAPVAPFLDDVDMAASPRDPRLHVMSNAVARPPIIVAPVRGHATTIGAEMLRRARLLWPRLDARALSRTRGDPARIARLVTRRSGLPAETILAMLRGGCPRRTAPRRGSSGVWRRSAPR